MPSETLYSNRRSNESARQSRRGRDGLLGESGVMLGEGACLSTSAAKSHSLLTESPCATTCHGRDHWSSGEIMARSEPRRRHLLQPARERVVHAEEHRVRQLA